MSSIYLWNLFSDICHFVSIFFIKAGYILFKNNLQHLQQKNTLTKDFKDSPRNNIGSISLYALYLYISKGGGGPKDVDYVSKINDYLSKCLIGFL